MGVLNFLRLRPFAILASGQALGQVRESPHSTRGLRDTFRKQAPRFVESVTKPRLVALLQDREDFLVGRARVGRGLQDDELILAQALGNLARR